jgi:hypothetical protein
MATMLCLYIGQNSELHRVAHSSNIYYHIIIEGLMLNGGSITPFSEVYRVTLFVLLTTGN